MPQPEYDHYNPHHVTISSMPSDHVTQRSISSDHVMPRRRPFHHIKSKRWPCHPMKLRSRSFHSMILRSRSSLFRMQSTTGQRIKRSKVKKRNYQTTTRKQKVNRNRRVTFDLDGPTSSVERQHEQEMQTSSTAHMDVITQTSPPAPAARNPLFNIGLHQTENPSQFRWWLKYNNKG
uniref:Uncharacterized protein n=1 Tax=Pyxicephalus adspersus TaxID=30357 RepID=A0AAV3ASK8_PYXAD|nr:TPA: hypothetical protein GDO54_006178 [Pyxicephalus adspersus]